MGHYLIVKHRKISFGDFQTETIGISVKKILIEVPKSLKQDPLRLLQGISRNRTVIASWNGTYTEGRLLYAELGHHEYRSYDAVDALIVGMDGMATVDSAINNNEARQK